MASMRDIKRRRSSIQSTQQITKAMKLVSTVKLQKARSHAEKTDPYFRYMYHTICSILARSQGISHPYLSAGSSDRKAVVAITSNRGLAGGYNMNVVRLVTENESFTKEDTDIYAIGAKGADALRMRGYHVVHEDFALIDNPIYSEASVLCKKVLKDFSDGVIGEIYLAYTHFKNTVSQEARLMRLLPADFSEEEKLAAQDAVMMNYEPNDEEALNQVIPKYITSLFYGALVEAVASENGARMQAMDSATNNANDMIEALSLKYNRARQGSITQELTEIIAGANAIE